MILQIPIGSSCGMIFSCALHVGTSGLTLRVNCSGSPSVRALKRWGKGRWGTGSKPQYGTPKPKPLEKVWDLTYVTLRFCQVEGKAPGPALRRQVQQQATLPGIGKHTGFHIVFKLEDVMQRRRAQRNTKRVRVSVQVKGHGGKVYGSADIEVEMPLSEELSYVVTPREQQEPAGTEEAVRDQLEEEFEREAADEEIEVATQAC